MTVASALPLAGTILEVDAGKDARVKSVCMTIVDDEVVEIRLQPGRCPAFIGAPSAWSVDHLQAPRAKSARRIAGAEQKVAVCGHSRLDDGSSLPGVLPKRPAVRRRDACGA